MRCTRITSDNRRCARWAVHSQGVKAWCWQHWRQHQGDPEGYKHQERHVVFAALEPPAIRSKQHLSLIVDNDVAPELPDAS